MIYKSLGHATAIVETAHCRVIIDPWLTERLDRFWVRNPPLPAELLDELGRPIDAIILTHHHLDHLHKPSLDLLARFQKDQWRANVPVFYPAQGNADYAESGMGTLPIALTLKQARYETPSPVTPGQSFTIGDLHVTAFPSRVRFPEMSVLLENNGGSVMHCADAILHPDTWSYFSRPGTDAPSLTLMPSHSVVPENVLTERKLNDGSFSSAIRESHKYFDRYSSLFGDSVCMPFANGWKVKASEQNMDWLNRVMYPFTPLQAVERLASVGIEGQLSTPGAVATIDGQQVSIAHRSNALLEATRAASRQIELDPLTVIPGIETTSDFGDGPTESSETLADRLVSELVGTSMWRGMLEGKRTYSLRILDGSGSKLFRISSNGVKQEPFRPLEAANELYLTIGAGTLQSMLGASLLYRSAWGLWTGNCNLLPSVFQHPRWLIKASQVAGVRVDE